MEMFSAGVKQIQQPTRTQRRRHQRNRAREFYRSNPFDGAPTLAKLKAIKIKTKERRRRRLSSEIVNEWKQRGGNPEIKHAVAMEKRISLKSEDMNGNSLMILNDINEMLNTTPKKVRNFEFLQPRPKARKGPLLPLPLPPPPPPPNAPHYAPPINYNYNWMPTGAAGAGPPQNWHPQPQLPQTPWTFPSNPNSMQGFPAAAGNQFYRYPALQPPFQAPYAHHNNYSFAPQNRPPYQQGMPQPYHPHPFLHV